MGLCRRAGRICLLAAVLVHVALAEQGEGRTYMKQKDLDLSTSLARRLQQASAVGGEEPSAAPLPSVILGLGPSPQPPPLGARQSVYTDRYDISRTGINSLETQLTPDQLRAGNFGRIGQYQVIGQVYGRPLIAHGINVGGNAVTGVLIVTMENYVYMFDADQVNNPAPLWVTKQLGIPVTDGDVGVFGPDGNVIVCDNVQPVLGILSTPVIDPADNVVYLVAQSKLSSASITNIPDGATFTLYSLDLSTGLDKYPPINITGSSTLNGETLAFKPTFHIQRSGLALANGHVIVLFGAHCDLNDFSGWAFAYIPSQNKATGIWRSVNRRREDGGGVWTAGGAPLVDPQGNIYVTTGNGLHQPENGYYGNAFVKLAPPPGNTISGAWRVLDFFIPADNPEVGDLDLGSCMLTLFNINGTDLVVCGGKAEKTWIHDINDMKGLSTDSYQAWPDSGFMMSSYLYDPLTQRLWNNPMIYGKTAKGLQAFQLQSDGYFNTTPVTTGPVQTGNGGTPTLTHNNGTDAILWTVGRYGLRAYDPTQTGAIQPIYNDSISDIPSVMKFQIPVVVNGLVYVGGDGIVSIYGGTEAISVAG